jgi:hypothetical protein
MAYVEAKIWLAQEAGPYEAFLGAWQVPLFDPFVGVEAGLLNADTVRVVRGY